MAEEETTEEQPKKKSPILLIVLIVVGALITLVATVLITLFAVGFFSEDAEDAAQEVIEQAEAEAAAIPQPGETVEILDEQGLPTGEFEKKAPTPPEKVVKDASQQTRFEHRYYELAKPFVSNVANSRKVMSATVAIMTQYDEQVMVNVESHQLALRSEILTIMSEFSSEDIAGKEGKNNLAESLRDGINEVLVKVEGFGGIENVHFTSFVVQ